MKTENKYTKQLITNRVLKALRGSTTPSKPVLRFPQDKFNSSSFFSVYQNTKEKSRGRLFRWQIGPLQAEGGSYFTHGDGGAPGPVGLVWTNPPALHTLVLVRPRPPASVLSGCRRVGAGNMGCCSGHTPTKGASGPCPLQWLSQPAPR